MKKYIYETELKHFTRIFGWIMTVQIHQRALALTLFLYYADSLFNFEVRKECWKTGQVYFFFDAL